MQYIITLFMDTNYIDRRDDFMIGGKLNDLTPGIVFSTASSVSRSVELLSRPNQRMQPTALSRGSFKYHATILDYVLVFCITYLVVFISSSVQAIIVSFRNPVEALRYE